MKLLDKILGTVENALGIVFLTGMVGLIFMQVVLRYGFNNALNWSEEMARYMMIWCTGFGIAAGVRLSAHIGIQAIVDALPKAHSKVVRIGCDVAILCVFVFLTYIAVLFAASAKASGQLTPSLRLPIFYVYAALPVSFTFCVIRQLQVIVMRYLMRHDAANGEEYTV